MQRNFLIVTTIFLLLEIYVYQAFKNIINTPLSRIIYWGITISVYAYIFYEILNFHRNDRDHNRMQIIVTLFLTFLIPKLLVVIFLLIDDIFRLVIFGYEQFSNSSVHYPERRKFLSYIGLGLGAILTALFLDGVIFGKYRHYVRKVKIKIPYLPESFKGYKIVQISDVHSGSFFHPEKLEKAIQLINNQQADLVLFTGDMVNNFAGEFEPFVPLFSTIRAKDAKLSILGNHDYGMYANLSETQKKQNVLDLIELEKKAGFTMLRNENVAITKNGESLYIIGVENWGELPFPQYGDLDKAVLGIPQDSAKILMSHDPTHFDSIVKKHPSNIPLTLSGHTHGMQFGIDLKNVKWSPVQYRYPKWADLYESEGKFLYVNRGFGVIGYPGRVGILPEITVFELN